MALTLLYAESGRGAYNSTIYPGVTAKIGLSLSSGTSLVSALKPSSAGVSYWLNGQKLSWDADRARWSYDGDAIDGSFYRFAAYLRPNPNGYAYATTYSTTSSNSTRVGTQFTNPSLLVLWECSTSTPTTVEKDFLLNSWWRIPSSIGVHNGVTYNSVSGSSQGYYEQGTRWDLPINKSGVGIATPYKIAGIPLRTQSSLATGGRVPSSLVYAPNVDYYASGGASLSPFVYDVGTPIAPGLSFNTMHLTYEFANDYKHYEIYYNPFTGVYTIKGDSGGGVFVAVSSFYSRHPILIHLNGGGGGGGGGQAPGGGGYYGRGSWSGGGGGGAMTLLWSPGFQEEWLGLFVGGSVTLNGTNNYPAGDGAPGDTSNVDGNSGQQAILYGYNDGSFFTCRTRGGGGGKGYSSSESNVSYSGGVGGTASFSGPLRPSLTWINSRSGGKGGDGGGWRYSAFPSDHPYPKAGASTDSYAIRLLPTTYTDHTRTLAAQSGGALGTLIGGGGGGGACPGQIPNIKGNGGNAGSVTASDASDAGYPGLGGGGGGGASYGAGYSYQVANASRGGFAAIGFGWWQA